MPSGAVGESGIEKAAGTYPRHTCFQVEMRKPKCLPFTKANTVASAMESRNTSEPTLQLAGCHWGGGHLPFFTGIFAAYFHKWKAGLRPPPDG